LVFTPEACLPPSPFSVRISLPTKLDRRPATCHTHVITPPTKTKQLNKENNKAENITNKVPHHNTHHQK